MTRKSFQACQYDRLTKTTRRWQIHAGSNHFCFNGHCITGKDLSGALLTIFLISFTSTLWFIFISPILIEELTLVILFVAILLIFYTLSKTTEDYPKEKKIGFVLVYFFRSMCMDPGIILRPSYLERTIFTRQYHVNEMTSAHLNHLIFDLSINKLLVQCKYCITCQMIRPPRSSHCTICSNCISILDHHCPFLSTCIGMRNYRFFIFFLFFLLQTELFFFATTLTKIFISSTDRISISSSISSYFILILTLPSAIYTCNLLGYHLMISSRALTTREDDKGIYLNGNPFQARSWYQNLARKFCTSLPPSAYGAHRLIAERV